jgi:anti-sigma-K factor RskA
MAMAGSGGRKGGRRADPHTLAGPYALNALPPRDRDRFERHLAACPACADEVRGLRETAARLAGAAAVQPPARLKERVLAEAARTRQLPPVAGQAGRAWPWRARWAASAKRRARWAVAGGRPSGSTGPSESARPGGSAWGGLKGGRAARPLMALTVATCAVFLVAAVVFGSMALITQHKLNQMQVRDHLLAAVLTAPDAKMMTGSVTGGGTVAIVMSHRVRALAFSTAGLPSLPPREAYELWLTGPPGPRSAAMLPKPTHGMTSPVIATGLRTGDAVELTVEPAGGAPHPTTKPILLMTL